MMVGFLSAPDAGVNAGVSQIANDPGVVTVPLPPHIVIRTVAFDLTERAKIAKHWHSLIVDRVATLTNPPF